MPTERRNRGNGAAVAMLTLALGCLPHAAAQRPVRTAADPPPLDLETVEKVVAAIAENLERSYVFEDVGRELAAMLRERLAAGAYDDVADATRLAEMLTAQLDEVAHDRHLRITPPGAALPGGGRVRAVRRAPGGEGEAGANETSGGARRVVVARPGDGQGAGTPTRPDPREMRLEDMPPEMRAMLEARIASARRQNHFFRKAEVLPGNVAYLDYDQFGFFPASRATADAAMRFLAETDAFILDLRGNPGGMEGMNQYLCSHFFGDEKVHLYSRFTRTMGGTSDYWSWPDEPAVHFPDVPLYILVDGRTGSAAENLGFALQGLGRAVIVGEPTAGGAHSSTRAGLPAGFQMVLPISRTHNPRTNEDWEGSGVQPDVAAEGTDALLAAHALAIDALRAATDDGARRAALEEARLFFRARNGETVEAPLGEYAGTYGVRRIWVEGEVLMLRRTDVAGAPALDLLALGDDTFAIPAVANARLRFERDGTGAVVRLHMQRPDGTTTTAPRTP